MATKVLHGIVGLDEEGATVLIYDGETVCCKSDFRDVLELARESV
jgi:hypothetical protein